MSSENKKYTITLFAKVKFLTKKIFTPQQVNTIGEGLDVIYGVFDKLNLEPKSIEGVILAYAKDKSHAIYNVHLADGDKIQFGLFPNFPTEKAPSDEN